MQQHKKRLESAKQRAFLAAYATTGNVSKAAEIATVTRQAHYRWLEEEEYVNAFGEAHDDACDALESEARRRAVEGFEEPASDRGQAEEFLKTVTDPELNKLTNIFEQRVSGHDTATLEFGKRK
jgi:hypothetical protein